MVILGLGGRERSHQHATHTAHVVNAINPTMLSALTLMLHPGTLLREAADKGIFLPLSPYEYVAELKELVGQLELAQPCIFRANHASNMLPLAGTLPAAKQDLLSQIDYALHVLRGRTAPTYNDHGSF